MTPTPRRFVRLFQPRFAEPILTGKKKQTIRRTPKRMPKPGDIIDCRRWTDKPYRSPQVRLMESPITRVDSIRITENECVIGIERHLLPNTLNQVALKDGFKDWPEMIEWFQKTHSLPFTGILIQWNPHSMEIIPNHYEPN